MPMTVELANSTPREVRLSPDGQRIYASGPDGNLRVYDAATGDLLESFAVGQALGNLDISPDGSFVMIVDTGLSFVYRVDTFTGEVARYSYPQNGLDGLMFDVVVLSDGTAMLTQNFNGSGWTDIRVLDLETGGLEVVGNGRQSSTLSRDATGDTVFIAEPNSSGGPLQIYTVGEGQTAQGGVGGFNRGVVAYNGEMAATYIYGSGIRVLDTDLNSVVTITTWDFGAVRDIAFSADGSGFYILNQDDNTIIRLNTTTWLVESTIDTGLDVGQYGGGFGGDGRLIVDPLDRFFTVITDDGFHIIENTNAPTILGTDGQDTILGALFADDIEAGDGADTVNGGHGDDTIDGGGNIDTAIVTGDMADYSVTQTSTGVFEVTGADGTDTLTNVEFLQFDDQTMRLRPGEGVSVTFDQMDPASYQDAMDNILDFDGNALGGNGSWLFIGAADVNGDGDVDQVLVNDAIGRFATIGTAPDGLVYFDDNGWAGETRVAGIYIDPLVFSGDVVQGSDEDSQRRFQNDLEIENINRVLGADDYDGDGLQEVYFALTDGTAYLRAVMETDGNIRYANYQSEAQVIQFLTDNGFGPETFADWFPADARAEKTVSAEQSTAPDAPEQIVGARAFDPVFEQSWSPDPLFSDYLI
ncbi:MAG: WD40 repeat domain-containing protein [Pseudomonadota bacterium]|nr:WD40 repeat domain-containing protein [Pseudomonadota bacterium]